MLKINSLIEYLSEKEDTLPQAMIDSLILRAQDTTYETRLQREMASYQASYSNAAYDIIRSELYDTVSDITVVKSWLDSLNSLSADKQLVDIFINEGDYTAADSLLDSIPYLYDLRGNDSMSFNIYKGFKSLQMDWMSDGKNIFQLDSIYVGYIEEYADTTEASVNRQARAILEFAYGYQYCDPYYLADSTQKSTQFNSDENSKLTEDRNKSISVYPNPSQGNVVLEYHFQKDINTADVKITDISGKEIVNQVLNGNSGKFLLNTEKLNPGIYFYIVKTTKGIESGKIILIK